MSAISELKRAKEHSDKRQYGAKHQIIKKMMTDDPDAFYIDSDDGKGIVGVTHKKTGFRFHMPTGKVKSGLSKEANVGEKLLKLLPAGREFVSSRKSLVDLLQSALGTREATSAATLNPLSRLGKLKQRWGGAAAFDRDALVSFTAGDPLRQFGPAATDSLRIRDPKTARNLSLSFSGPVRNYGGQSDNYDTLPTSSMDRVMDAHRAFIYGEAPAPTLAKTRNILLDHVAEQQRATPGVGDTAYRHTMNQAVDALGSVSGARRKLFLRDAPIAAGLGYGAYDASQSDGRIRSWLRDALGTEERVTTKEARLGGIPRLSELMSKLKDSNTAQSLLSQLPSADDITGAGGKLANKTLRFLERHPKAEERLRQATSYRLLDPRNRGKNTTAGSLLGGVPGAGVGGLVGASSERGNASNEKVETSPGKWRDRTLSERFDPMIRKALIGAGLGGVGGAGAGAAVGRYGPRTAQRTLGRIITSSMDPYTYDTKMHAENLKTGDGFGPPKSARDILSGIWHNKPLSDSSTSDPGRLAAFRDYFDLKRFDGTEDHFKTIKPLPNGGRMVELNPEVASARKEIDEVDTKRLNSVMSSNALEVDTHGVSHYAPARHMQAGKPTLMTAGAMANFHVKPDGNWEDEWDFALHPHEKIDSIKNLLRSLVTPFGTPTTIVGKTMSQGEALRKVNPRGRLGEIHESISSPVINRAVRGAGLNPEEFNAYMVQASRTGNHQPFTKAMGDRLEGGPYNLLRDMAAHENTTPSDMQAFLGGSPRRTRAVDRSPKWKPGDLSSMYAHRIPGANPSEVESAINQLPADQASKLRSKLTTWSAAGHPPGGEVDALASVLGFSPDDLPVLLG